MILDSISHIVCKFPKDWLVNKKKAKWILDFRTFRLLALVDTSQETH